MWEQTIVSILYTHSQFIYCQGNDTFLHIILFSFQLAKGGTESAVYNKLIAPFKNDMPNSYVEGFGKVCADHKYAFFGVNILKTKVSCLSLVRWCHFMELPTRINGLLYSEKIAPTKRSSTGG